jgi:hypothetical protein
MLPGQPASFQVYKCSSVVDLQGNFQLQGPLGAAPALEGAHALAKHLQLDRYLIVMTVGIWSNIPIPAPSQVPIAPTQNPN